MKGRGIGGFIMVAILVLGVIYGYNRFIAKDGKTVADLGRPEAK